MQEFLDRIPGEGMANRKKITYENGDVEYVFVENADNPVTIGTPLNRKNMMAIQGFDDNNIVFNADGSITQTNSNNETLTSFPINIEGISTQIFVGEKTITKTCHFKPNAISEVLS